MRAPAILLLVLMMLPSALAPLGVLGQQSSFEKILEVRIDVDSTYTEAYYSMATLFTLTDDGTQRPYVALAPSLISGLYFHIDIYDVTAGKRVKRLTQVTAREAIPSGSYITLVDVRSLSVLATSKLQVDTDIYNTVYPNMLPNGTTYVAALSLTFNTVQENVFIYSGSGTRHYTISYPRADLAGLCGAEVYSLIWSVAAVSGDTVIRPFRLKADNDPVAFVVESRDEGLASCVVHDFGSKYENDRASIGFMASKTGEAFMWADGLYPYLAGLDGVDEIYVYKSGWDGVKVLKNPGFIRDMEFAQLRLAMDSSGRTWIVVLDREGDTPRLVFLDPDTLTVVKELRLNGYTARYAAIDVGYYYGAPALYIGVDGYVVVVSLDTMEPVHALEVVPIDSVMIVNYNRGSGGDVLLVRGPDTGEAEMVTQVYSHLGTLRGTMITLEVPQEQVDVGGTIEARIKLATVTGTPLQGRLVEVQRLVDGTWETIATGVTGQDGSTVIRIGVTERGPWILRAVYNGGQGEAASWSGTREVSAMERVKVEISSPRTWIESLPLPVEVKVTSLATGAPVRGVWVAVCANLSGVRAQVGAALTAADGRAVASISLPAGMYSLTARVMDPYIVVDTLSGASVEVRPPATPLPEGPYIAPLGRVVASSPVVAEPGSQATVLFALYYGEVLVNATSVAAWVEGVGVVPVEQAGTGLYLVSFTPPEPGVYLVVLEAGYGGVKYLGTAEVLAVNLTGKVEEWDAMIRVTVEDLQGISALLIDYLDSINASLQALNVTMLVGMIAEVQGNTALLLDYAVAINTSLAQALGSLSEVRAIAYEGREMLLLLNDNVFTLLGVLNASLLGINAGLAEINTSIGVIVAGISAIATGVEELGDSVFRIETVLGNVTLDLAGLAAAIDEGIEATLKVLGLVDSLQGVILEVRDNTVKVLTATGEVREVVVGELQPKVLEVGDKLALLDSKLGLLAARADEIAGLTSKTGEDLGRVEEKIDQLSTKLDEVSAKLDQLEGVGGQDMVARGLGGVAVLLGVIALVASRRK